MTITPLMQRVPALALALVWTTLSISALISPDALSAQSKAYYVATLAAPAQSDRVVARGVVWTCRDTTCVANKRPSRPLRVCRGLARELGTVTRFVADGDALADDRLARCNGE